MICFLRSLLKLHFDPVINGILYIIEKRLEEKIGSRISDLHNHTDI